MTAKFTKIFKINAIIGKVDEQKSLKRKQGKTP